MPLPLSARIKRQRPVPHRQRILKSRPWIGYALPFDAPSVTIIAESFTWEPVVTATYVEILDFRAEIVGESFTWEPLVIGGSRITAESFTWEPVVTASYEYTATIIAESFTWNPVVTGSGGYSASIVAESFTWNPTITGGSRIVAESFTWEPVVTSTADYHANIVAESFTWEPVVTASYAYTCQVVAESFTWEPLVYGGAHVVAESFTWEPTVSASYDADYAEAYVLNLLTNQVTRYTDFPFFHIAKVGAYWRGFNANGIYTIGATKVTTNTITTSETDFDTYQSKNVHVLYADSDTEFDVTPIVDGEISDTSTAIFDGRKAKMGRGNKGRYWAFKLDNISALHGLEYLPEALQRRVK